MLRFLCIWPLAFSWNCALVFSDSTIFAFIFLGVGPRIENVMDCVPREWQIFGIREVHIFVLVDGGQFDSVAFFSSVACCTCSLFLRTTFFLIHGLT